MNWMGLSEHQHLYAFQHKGNHTSTEISMSGTSSNPLATDWFMIITTKIYFCFRIYWKERYISHSTISSQVKSQKSSSIFFLSGNETLLKTLFCILFFHMALLTYFGQTFGDIFSMTYLVEVLKMYTLFNRKHCQHTQWPPALYQTQDNRFTNQHW